MSDISDEAVEKACRAFDDARDLRAKTFFECMTDALGAALPYLKVWAHNAFIRSSDENLQLQARIRELEDAIRQHRDAEKSPTEYGEQADEDLYALLPDDDRYTPSDDQPQIGDF